MRLRRLSAVLALGALLVMGCTASPAQTDTAPPDAASAGGDADELEPTAADAGAFSTAWEYRTPTGYTLREQVLLDDERVVYRAHSTDPDESMLIALDFSTGEVLAEQLLADPGVGNACILTEAAAQCEIPGRPNSSYVVLDPQTFEERERHTVGLLIDTMPDGIWFSEGDTYGMTGPDGRLAATWTGASFPLVGPMVEFAGARYLEGYRLPADGGSAQAVPREEVPWYVVSDDRAIATDKANTWRMVDTEGQVIGTIDDLHNAGVPPKDAGPQCPLMGERSAEPDGLLEVFLVDRATFEVTELDGSLMLDATEYDSYCLDGEILAVLGPSDNVREKDVYTIASDGTTTRHSDFGANLIAAQIDDERYIIRYNNRYYLFDLEVGDTVDDAAFEEIREDIFGDRLTVHGDRLIAVGSVSISSYRLASGS